MCTLVPVVHIQGVARCCGGVVGVWWGCGGGVVGVWWGCGGGVVGVWWGCGGGVVGVWWGVVGVWWGCGGSVVGLCVVGCGEGVVGVSLLLSISVCCSRFLRLVSVGFPLSSDFVLLHVRLI